MGTVVTGKSAVNDERTKRLFPGCIREIISIDKEVGRNRTEKLFNINNVNHPA